MLILTNSAAELSVLRQTIVRDCFGIRGGEKRAPERRGREIERRECGYGSSSRMRGVSRGRGHRAVPERREEVMVWGRRV
jgi:hypothetical protein